MVAAAKTPIRIAVVESDPLRFVGFRAIFDTEPDFQVQACSVAQLLEGGQQDIVLLGGRSGFGMHEAMMALKQGRPDIRIIVTGTGTDDESVLRAISAGAKGYLDEAASPAEFKQAIRVVHSGSVWASRRVLSLFIERVTSSPRKSAPQGQLNFTEREREVLQLLVAGRSNREIGAALGIEERTVKAHVAKLMRKVGVQNRIALSVHAITHELLPPQD